MRRREFILLIGGVASVCPLATRAQQASTSVVGFLSSRSPSESSGLVDSFRKGLRQMGFVEGQNVNIAFRWADGRYERLPVLASELVDLPVAVLFAAGGTPAALAAKAATSTIPVVFLTTDPVGLGLVASLSHPGGNLTGICNLASDLPSKSTELLKQLMPAANVIAYLVNPTNPSSAAHARQASLAANALSVEFRVINAGTSQELADGFAELAKRRIIALGVMADAFLDSQRERIVALSVQNGIAGCYPWRDYVLAGGMMATGRTCRTPIGRPPSTWDEFFAAKSLLTCRSCSLQESSWCLISRRPRHWVSPCHLRSSP
jgi:putative ABC transport system substrate-binding protein